MKIIIFSVLISSVLQLKQLKSTEPENAGKSPVTDTTKFEKVFILGLRGDLSEAISYLDTLKDEELTERQLRIKNEYYTRFRDKNENFRFKSNDSQIIELQKIYHNYWRNALLDNKGLSRYESELTKETADFLKENHAPCKDKAENDIQENFPQYLQDYLGTKGIFAATGKTGMFFDLLMHAKETGVLYDVTTPEDTLKVKVIFMEEIISNGWEEYATFGKYYPGGWTTSDALYCIKEGYDLESENFNISYLKHEGKHFADYKTFPKLTGADLEYRAKLVELSSAKESLHGLIRFFIRNSKYDRQNPHGFANYCVIRDLSKQIFNDETVTDTEKWKTVSTEIINNSAIDLLKKNTEALKAAGAETVKEFIK